MLTPSLALLSVHATTAVTDHGDLRAQPRQVEAFEVSSRWSTLPKAIGKLVERGFTLVPVRMYFRKGLVKVTVGVAKGKKTYDKRETIKRRQIDRETRAMVKERLR